MMRRILYLSALVFLALIGRAQATCPTLPFSFVNGTIADATQVNANFSDLFTCFNGSITVLGVVTAGDISALARPLASRLPTPNNFYVGGGGASDGNNCLALVPAGGNGPCATVNHALAVALGYDAGQANLQINIAAGTYLENVALSGNPPGVTGNAAFLSAGTLPMVLLSGAGSGSTIIKNVGMIAGLSYCYAVLSQNGAVIGLQSLAVEADGAPGSCIQSDLYAQFEGTIFILSDVALLGANCNSVALEEHGRLIISPGIGATALTVKGNAGCNFFNIDSGSMVQSDSPIAFSGSPVSGNGLIFVAEYASLFKLSASPHGTSGAPGGSPRFFSLNGLSVLQEANPPSPQPGTTGAVNYGSRYEGADNQTCIGGTGGCVNANAPSLGNGSVGIAPGSSSYGGAVTITAGTTTGPVGVVPVGFNPILQNGSCAISRADGTGAWPSTSAFYSDGFTTNSGANLNFNTNGAGLVAGSTYSMVYNCTTGK